MRTRLAHARRSDRPPDRGDTLVELLIAVLVMSITAAALINSLIASSTSSVEHRSLASLDGVLRSFAESATFEIQMQGAGSGSGPLFTPCASSYELLSAPTPVTGPTGSTVTVFATGFPPSVPLQPVTLTPAPSGTPTSVPVSASTDANGDATVTFTVPSGLSAGSYSIDVADGLGQSALSNSDFVVTPTGTPTTSGPLDQYHLQASVQYLNSGNNFQPTCDHSGIDSDIQQLTVTATAQNGTSDKVSFVVTDPGSEYPEISSPYGDTLDFHAGIPGSYTLQVTGFRKPSLLCSCATLPASITFNSLTGVLSGTPAAADAGPYTITLTASNSKGPPVTQSFNVLVYGPPNITSPVGSTLVFYVGTKGSYTVQTTGYPTPITLSCSCLALPASITFDPSTGVLSGTPAAGDGGSYSITITATNSQGTTSHNYNVIVYEAPTITSPDSATFTATGPPLKTVTFYVTANGYATPTFACSQTAPGGGPSSTPCSTAGVLPASLTFISQGVSCPTPSVHVACLTGKLRNTAGIGGVYNITFTATNQSGTTSRDFTLTILQAPKFTSPPATGTAVTWSESNPNTFTAHASGYPVTYTATNVPAWATFDPATGVLSGQPPSTDPVGTTYPAITFAVTNSAGSTTSGKLTITAGA